MPMNEQTIQCVIRAKAGDEQSFSQLYYEYYQKVYALALQTVKNPADAEDVLQTTFIKAWRNLGSLQNPAAFNTWIQRITLNECTDLLRRRNPMFSVDQTDEDDAPLIEIESDLMLPEAYAEQEDLSARLRRIIFSLSDVQRQTITLFYFEGLKIPEIAEVMDCNENTVKSRLYLARKSIKTEIEEQERKTGTKFYAVPLLPFGKIFTDQMWRNVISPSRAAFLYSNIQKAVFAGAAVAGTASAVGMSAGMKALLGTLIGVIVVSAVASGIAIAGIVNEASKDRQSATTAPVATVSAATTAPVSEVTEAATTATQPEPTTEEPTEEPTTEEPTTVDIASVVFGEMAGKYYMAKGGGYGVAGFDVNADGSFQYGHKEGNTPMKYEDGSFTGLTKQSEICYQCTIQSSYEIISGQAARIYTPETSLDDMPDDDAQQLIDHLMVGFGDRTKAEQTLSDPIGCYVIIVDGSGIAFIDNTF